MQLERSDSVRIGSKHWFRIGATVLGILAVIGAMYVICTVPPWKENTIPMIVCGLIAGVIPWLIVDKADKKVTFDLPTGLIALVMSVSVILCKQFVRSGMIMNILTMPQIYLLIGILWGTVVKPYPGSIPHSSVIPVVVVLVTVLFIALAQRIRSTLLNMLVQLWPILYGVLLINLKPYSIKSVRVIMTIVFIVPIVLVLWALLIQAQVLKVSDFTSDLNTVLFRMKGMSNFTSCLLVLSGAFVRTNLINCRSKLL